MNVFSTRGMSRFERSIIRQLVGRVTSSDWMRGYRDSPHNVARLEVVRLEAQNRAIEKRTRTGAFSPSKGERISAAKGFDRRGLSLGKRPRRPAGEPRYSHGTVRVICADGCRFW